ncbi:hypothetical protein K488DRAFT_72805 [Vararia minispora EC-137]|uniref:Uncharacterized protein n=1 Tax=Vararia minispora EC-137 TaxID=1314806 RepID=A0ACB8QDJ2_9AGAM|nr:hypothetical protein K488DRAFT_72805 [Vararia minispora EC-137]
MFVALAAAAALASTAYAQSLNLSSSCQSTLGSIATGPDGTCLNAAGLVTFATVNSNSSLITPLNSWLTGMCSQSQCSNQTLANIVSNITSGCSSDLSSLGFSSSSTSTVVSDVQQFYPTVREIVCLKNTTSNNLCATDLLTDVQNSVGTLSQNNLQQIVVSIIGGSQTLESVLNSASCSDCFKAAYNVINTNFPSLMTSAERSNFTSTCGANFTNGQNPSTVSQTAAGLSSANGSTSGALAAFPVTSLALALSALASAFAFFA